MERSLWYEPKLDPNAKPVAAVKVDESKYGVRMPQRVFGLRDPFFSADDPEPNLIGSLVDSTLVEDESPKHMPVFDFDGVPMRLVPSSTPGNFHLYIDRPIEWMAYVQILLAFMSAGLIERAWYDATIAQRVGFVRVPGVQRLAPREPIFNRDPGDETTVV